MKKISTKQLLAASLSGILLFAASPGYIGFPPLAWLALVPLLYAISRRGTSRRSAIILGFASGIFYYPAIFYWITIVLGRYGNFPLWLSFPALLLLSLYMSLYLAAFAAVCNHLQKRYSLLWIAPTVWVGLDFLRGWLFTGFPWFDLAYTQFQTPLLIQIADITGHHGVSFLIVMVNTLICHTFGDYRRLRTIKSGSDFAFRTAIMLVLTVLSYNAIRFTLINNQLSGNETLGVAVIQGNINQDQKWAPKFQRHTLAKYIKLSQQIMATENPGLVVWPETALPFYLSESYLLKDIRELSAQHPGTTILTGAPYRQKSPAGLKTKYYNSAFFVDATGLRENARYDKQHLVPFGEYVPLKKLLPFLAPLVETVSDFTPGSVKEPVPCQNFRVGVLICFESIFPILARQQTKEGADILVNLTNDAWYGKSSAPWQHLAMAVYRAVENRRSLARSANTGFSVFIDPLGRMHELSPLFEDFFGYNDLPILTTKSVFTFYGGHMTGFICLLISIFLSILAKRKRRFNL